MPVYARTLLVLFLWRTMTQTRIDEKRSVYYQGADQGGLGKFLGHRLPAEHRNATGARADTHSAIREHWACMTAGTGSHIPGCVTGLPHPRCLLTAPSYRNSENRAEGQGPYPDLLGTAFAKVHCAVLAVFQVRPNLHSDPTLPCTGQATGVPVCSRKW